MSLDLAGIEPQIAAALAEDIGPGDVTTRLFVPEDALGSARIMAKAAGVVSGVDVALLALRLGAGRAFSATEQIAEGTQVAPGDCLLVVSGPARALLAAERVALNFLMRLSGIATLTARFVAAVDGTGARILDTRKTTPGWRALEKRAVVSGGGTNHRYALYDAVLVKENHRGFGADLAAALAARPAGMEAIVEAETLEEYRAAAAAGADVVLLDDFTPDEVRRAHAERGDAPRPLLEVSGGVTLATVRAYAEAGADRISVGALTHSAPALDLSMAIGP